MKKILIAFDDSHFSEGAFEAARSLNELEPILLVGFFLPAVYYANTPVGVEDLPKPFYVPLVEEEDINVIEESIIRFEEKCNDNDIKYLVHKNLVDAAIPSLKIETRFADLLIIGSEMFYKNLGKVKPNQYLRHTMREAECPILIVPEKFNIPTLNILAYNGDESSVYAAKQFKYLFPQLKKNKTLMLVATRKSDVEIPELSFMEEYVINGFPDFELRKVDFDARKFLGTWISEKEGAILITGSYGRSELSEIVRPSFVTDVISQHYIPVFIAHK
jgi:nucleotide-binding universal stress UspA family protein